MTFRDNSMLIILVYEGSPAVHLCLNSIMEAVDPIRSWHIAFLNLSPDARGVESLEDKCKLFPKSYTVYDFPMTQDELDNSGSVLGYALNRALLANKDSDVAVVIRDCDEMVSRYLYNLNNYFSTTLNAGVCYSHVIPKNKLVPDRSDIKNFYLNTHLRPLSRNGLEGIHLTQLAWRLSLNHEKDCWFDFPSDNLEQKFYDSLYNNNGAITYSGHTSHYFEERGNSLMSNPKIVWLLAQASHALMTCDFPHAKQYADKVLEFDPKNKKAKSILATVEYTG